MSKSCSACLMPFKMDEGERKNPAYCSYCQEDGKFRFKGNRKEFQKLCYTSMRKNGMNAVQAKLFTWMIRFAPQWKR